MDITIDRKRKKKESERASELQLKDTHIDSLKKNKPIIIPGTSKPMPPFDYDDPNVRLWINNRIDQLKTENPTLTYENFLTMVANKIEYFDEEEEFFIDEEELLIENNKICALPPDWEQQMERDYERGRRYWETKLQRMSPSEIDKLVDIKINLMKENPKLSSKEASDVACKQVLAKRESNKTETSSR